MMRPGSVTYNYAQQDTLEHGFQAVLRDMHACGCRKYSYKSRAPFLAAMAVVSMQDAAFSHALPYIRPGASWNGANCSGG